MSFTPSYTTDHVITALTTTNNKRAKLLNINVQSQQKESVDCRVLNSRTSTLRATPSTIITTTNSQRNNHPEDNNEEDELFGKFIVTELRKFKKKKMQITRFITSFTNNSYVKWSLK